MIKLVYPEFWAENNWQSRVLIPFSWIYRFLGWLRYKFTKPIKFQAKVICVGNMSVGGTGKTQIVLWLAKKLTNHNFLIVTKGYGSTLSGAKLVSKDDDPAEVGDESIMLAEFATVIAATNVRAALPLIKQQQPEIIIFDDGMQNPSFIKDTIILAIDAARTVGNGLIFPAGPLRETSRAAISKSDIIMLIGNIPCNNFALINDIILSKKPFFKAGIKLISALEQQKTYYAFTAIGNPERFYQLLKDHNLTIAGEKSFPDHHNYTQKEIAELQEHAKKHNYILLTTRKDYVKLASKDYIMCVDVELDIENEQNLLGLLA